MSRGEKSTIGIDCSWPALDGPEIPPPTTTIYPTRAVARRSGMGIS